MASTIRERGATKLQRLISFNYASKYKQQYVAVMNYSQLRTHVRTYSHQINYTVPDIIVDMQTEIDTFFKTLVDGKSDIGLRYQAVFQLKNIDHEQAVLSLVKAYPYLHQSVLLSHQVLYTLGQLNQSRGTLIKDFLISVVQNEKDSNLSRHEAAEALANYFLPQLASLYERHLHSQCKELRWTCEIASQKVARPQLRHKYGLLYANTKQPAAPFDVQEFTQFLKQHSLEQVFKEQSYRGILLRDDISLFLKYRIMYLMRNQNTLEIKRTLCELISLKFFKTQTSLLKHQISFILGQIGCGNWEYLVHECIQNEEEESIVRHEALAAVASQSQDSAYLNKFINSPNTLIKQSAQVAQFEIHYWND